MGATSANLFVRIQGMKFTRFLVCAKELINVGFHEKDGRARGNHRMFLSRETMSFQLLFEHLCGHCTAFDFD
jgi:hypothetical protein